MGLKPGDVIHSARWPEPLQLDLIEEVGDYFRIVGATVTSRQHVDQLVPRSELEQIATDTGREILQANPRHVFLSVEAYRYRFASLYDPLLAMNTSKVDPLPHQIEAVYGYVLKLPRIRFLIADDPGAGKTIMAGLIIKELKLRGMAKRILIIVPGHLKDQWRRELKERFEESFAVVDRGLIDALYGENVWMREMQLITSIDFAKQEDVLPSITAAHFDLVIVDEAHKMSAYRYGDKVDKTGRYRLGEALSQASTHLLFLTATPHSGDTENFRLFLDLLEPGFFATTEMLQESIKQQDNPLFIRRVKEDLRDFEGKPLFLPRHVETKAFNLGVESPDEKTLYNALSEYVEKQYNKALTHDKRRNVAFALVILQRRLASSTYALYRSLTRRKKRLEEMLETTTNVRIDERDFDFDVTEDLSEEERWEREELWETLSVAENRQELQREVATLDSLIRQARAIIDNNNNGEVKLRHFRQALDELNRLQPGAKVLIFTESRDTLDYLEKRLHEWEYSVCTIHGGMKLTERIKAESVFRNEAQFMIATEAAGEGINLQFCNLMVNYDIPWNPNRLEQRMGRIHRYGQRREVYIVNLVAEDTREGRVLWRLFQKLKEIQAALGSDKVFDVLGDIIQGKNLAQMLLDAAANARSIEEILSELDITVDEDYIRQVKENLGESLATHYIDYTRIKEMAEQSREHRLIPEYTEAFFKRAMDASEGRYHQRQDTKYLTVDSIPFPIRQMADDDTLKKRYGEVLRRYPLVTFDKTAALENAQAEFVSFGHPLFESVLAWVERDLTTAMQQGAMFTDPDGRMDGLLMFYQGEIRDGNGAVAGTRLFALYVDRVTENINITNPAILWDLLEGGELPAYTEHLQLNNLKRRAAGVLLPHLESYRQELVTERARQAHIKEKYGVVSLEYLVVKLDGDLIDLYARRDHGDNVDLVIRNKEEQKRGYERALDDLTRNVAHERSLTLSNPRFVGLACVVPGSVASDIELTTSEVEAVGMMMAISYERAQGRVAEDVSRDDLGFDVRSTDLKTQQRRHIEVKARSEEGAVQLRQNEWFVAQRFGEDYYLYVVLNAATTPELHIVQNPAAVIEPNQEIEVRYRINVGDIKSKGIKA
jgi:SNF2 family DNA or RNA helicase